MATIYPVFSSKPYQSIRVSLAEVLVLGPAKKVPDDLVLEAGWALHELDFANNRAVFLETATENTFFAAPFAYQAHVTSARQAAFVTFDEFINLSAQLDLPKRLIHLFNIGHCGSTLLHQVFNASGAAQCISEPKFTFDLPSNRSRVSPKELQSLTAASLRFLARFPGVDLARPLVLKHFSQGCRVLETWVAAAPAATNLFLYRDALSWANSRYGFIQRKGFESVITQANKHQRWQAMSIGEPEETLDGIVDMNSPSLRFEDFAAVAWALFMRDIARAKEAGVALNYFRYNELNNDRRHELAKIFAVCALTPASLNAALTGFEKDSHAGTASARAKPARPLPPDAGEHIARILNHPKLLLDLNRVL